MVWDNHWTDQKNWILTYSIYVISQFLGGFDSPICLQFHFSIRFLKIHVSSGLKPRGHPSISLVDQSVDLTYVKRDRLATGLLVLERFRKRLGLGIKVFELAFFWISKERQISLYRFFFGPIREWFPLVWNLWDFFVDFFFFSRDSLKATFWNSKLWPVRKGFTAAAALYLFLCWYKARGNEAPTLIRCNFGMGSGCHGLTESFTESVMIFKLWLNRGWE